ncbi:MAG: hypothetical protein DVB25_04370 [Verrucomicrobia bacterium]|nr:MAG: hypothetical protein DVB25_04370 [Verrucomicrobiota bacterium]
MRPQQRKCHRRRSAQARPCYALADFVNRCLANNSTGRMGALQVAIAAAQLNERLQAGYPLDNSRTLPDY